MCTNYMTVAQRVRLSNWLQQNWGQQDWQIPDPVARPHIFNHYPAPFVRSHPHADVGDDAVPPVEVLDGEFGLIPFWSKEARPKYSMMNARTETVATSAAYKSPWAKGQRCIIPAEWIVEPDWRTGKHIPTRIGRADGEVMGIAGLWERWQNPQTREAVFSFTMLTINADHHPLMQNFHKPGDEKRMVVVLPEDRYQDWLTCPVEQTRELLAHFPAERLIASGAPAATND